MIEIMTEEIQCFDPQGAITVTGGTGDLMYSIDGGATFGVDSTFANLEANLYDIIVRKNDITSCQFEQPVILQAPDCAEADDVSCSDGIDNDGDGLIDCADEDCLPMIEDLMVMAPDTCPTLDNGLIEIFSSFPNLEYSIDSGVTYVPDPIFMDLNEGDYFIFIRNMMTQCDIAYVDNPVSLLSEEVCVVPDEDCQDGIDNDGDGLIDCADSDCVNFDACINVPMIAAPNIISLSSQNNNVFNLFSAEPLNIESLSIFDRYGNQVFHRESEGFPIVGWDGTFNNDEVENGVYIYYAVLNVDGRMISQTGDVTVID